MKKISLLVTVLTVYAGPINASSQSLDQRLQGQRSTIQKLFALTEELTTPDQAVELGKLDDYLSSLKRLVNDSGEGLYVQQVRNGEVVLTPVQQLVTLAHDRFIPTVALMRGGGTPRPADYAFIQVAYNRMQRPDVAR